MARKSLALTRLALLLSAASLVFADGIPFNGSDTIAAIQFPATIAGGDFSTFTYVFDGAVGHVLRNITAELMIGKAEDNGQDVADIIMIHVADTDPVLSDDFGYQIHADIPGGNYHLRVNGSVFNTLEISGPNDPGTPIGKNVTTRSKTFIITAGPLFVCTHPVFTAVPSVDSPLYSPLRLSTPNAGDVFYLTNLSDVKTISVQPNWVDESFELGKIPKMTMELVESGTGKVAGSVVLNSTTDPSQFLPVDQFPGLTAGAWKVRANFTVSNHAGDFVALSDEFYVASAGNCAGLQSGNSTTTTGGGSGSGSNTTTTPTGGGKTGAAIRTRTRARTRVFPALSLVGGLLLAAMEITFTFRINFRINREVTVTHHHFLPTTMSIQPPGCTIPVLTISDRSSFLASGLLGFWASGLLGFWASGLLDLRGSFLLSGFFLASCVNNWNGLDPEISYPGRPIIDNFIIPSIREIHGHPAPFALSHFEGMKRWPSLD
ncbi:hypothetical protein C8F01DRAFT_1091220 [Mycena amicta]|nr:hypothetical protein C8F01DRAFT_1091220 [Mycena amicta]